MLRIPCFSSLKAVFSQFYPLNSRDILFLAPSTSATWTAIPAKPRSRSSRPSIGMPANCPWTAAGFRLSAFPASLRHPVLPPLSSHSSISISLAPHHPTLSTHACKEHDILTNRPVLLVVAHAFHGALDAQEVGHLIRTWNLPQVKVSHRGLPAPALSVTVGKRQAGALVMTAGRHVEPY